MGKDFAKKTRRKGSRTRKSSTTAVPNPWAWLFTGLFFGAIMATVVIFKLYPSFLPAQGGPSVIQIAESADEQAVHKPRFDFYSLLPELEVVVADNTPSSVDENIDVLVQDLATSGESGTTYRLQLASFQDHEDADRLKAQMALLGISVEIETVTLEDGATWHRVRSSTYASRSGAERVREQLQAQSIQSLLLEEKIS